MKRNFFLLMIVIFLAGCTKSNQPTLVSQPTTAVLPQDTTVPTPTLAPAAPTTAPTEAAPTAAVQPTEPIIPPTAAPTAAIPPAATAVPQEGPASIPGGEAILIQEPGPGWRLTSPIHIAGMADPTFEQHLVVRLLADDGSELALVPATIAADAGQRGPFAVDVPFTVSGERQAFLQVYATSARDGGITHLSSVGLTIAESGPEKRPSFEPLNERIKIIQPQLNALVNGGTVHVEGVALASFEQTLLVEVLDELGTVIGSSSVIVNASDVGIPGLFQVDIPIGGGLTGAGRVVVHDISPAFGGDVHLASVEIRFSVAY